MPEYRVQQKATIWYQVDIEANSPIEAIELAREGEIQDGWEQVWDSTEFQDEFYTEETGLYPKEGEQ